LLILESFWWMTHIQLKPPFNNEHFDWWVNRWNQKCYITSLRMIKEKAWWAQLFLPNLVEMHFPVVERSLLSISFCMIPNTGNCKFYTNSTFNQLSIAQNSLSSILKFDSLFSFYVISLHEDCRYTSCGPLTCGPTHLTAWYCVYMLTNWRMCVRMSVMMTIRTLKWWNLDKVLFW